MMFLLFAPMTGGYRGLGTAITQSITLYHFKLFLISIDFSHRWEIDFNTMHANLLSHDSFKGI